MRRTASYYPDKIEIVASGINLVSDRESLQRALAEHATDTQSFYTLGAAVALRDYIEGICNSGTVTSAIDEICRQVGVICVPAHEGAGIQPDTLVSRLSSAQNGSELCPVFTRFAIEARIEHNGSVLKLAWRDATLDIYNRFVDHFIASRNCSGSSVKLAELMVAARRWFVQEERLNRFPIPHKTTRRMVIIRTMNERFGAGTLEAGRGVKCTMWAIPAAESPPALVV
jgi:hypothetical protein